MPRTSVRWTTVLMASISAARIGMGLFNGVYGPTMLFLSDNVDRSVSTLSYIFSGRSIGILSGAFMGGVIKRRTGQNFRHLFPLGVGLAALGVVTMLIPWIKNFPLLVLDITIGGIMYGYLDAGLQALILQEWGEKGSRVHIQIFHFMYCVGAFIAPFIASPFLVMAHQQKKATDSCSAQEEENSTIASTATPGPFASNATEIAPTISGFNPVGWTYIIAAVFMMLVGALNVTLAAFNVEAKVSKVVKKVGLAPEERPEEPLRDVFWLFFIVVCYYFCSVTSEQVYYNFIYSVSLCSGLHFSVSNASYLTSLTWLGFALARLVGIFAAAYLKPRTIIICSLVGAIIDSALMCIFGEQTPWLAWTVSFSHGFTPSLLYSSGVSWLSQITNVSGFYMFIFSVGNSVGPLSMLPLAGYIFDINPFGVMYLVLGIAVTNAVIYAVAVVIGKRHVQFVKKKSLLESIATKGEYVNMTDTEGIFTEELNAI